MSFLSRALSRKATKQDEKPFNPSASSKPGLAVDTSFTRHHAKAPEQIFPERPPLQEVRFVSLTDVRALKQDAKQELGSKWSARHRQQLDNKVYTPPSKRTLADPAAVKQVFASHDEPQQASKATNMMHKRVKGLRPAALELTTDVSPSDRAIPIGIELPANMARSKLSSSASDDCIKHPTHESHQAGRDLPTPTIVITPAREDFGATFVASPEDTNLRVLRPTSSVYSRDTVLAVDGKTPPVPPLPLFAAQSNASLQTTRDLAPARTGAKRRSTITLQTVFEDEGRAADKSSFSADSRYSTAASLASRRSRGWWNVITSPFSPFAKSPGAFFRSPPQLHESTPEESEPIFSRGAGMGRSKTHGAMFKGTGDDAELRSAPATAGPDDRSNLTGKTSRLTAQRSVTAPGALDMGKVDEVNIYRQPSKGAARSYFDRDSLNEPRRQSCEAARGLAIDDWSPSQDCYRDSSTVDKVMRDSEFYLVPGKGEAATYYNSNVRFPSLAPYGAGFGDRGLNWDPRNSVAPVICNASDSSSELLSASLASSPLESLDGKSIDTERAAVSSVQDALASTPVVHQPPYPVNTDPFRDPQQGQYDDLGQSGVRGYVPDLTPNSGDVTAFKDFSATHPAAQTAFFPDSPDDALSCSNPGPGCTEHKDSEEMFSPLETPRVEEARTATFMPSEAQREVEVASTRQRPVAEYGGGLGIATMSSREMNGSDYGSSVKSSLDDSESGREGTEHPAENTKGNFGYLADKREPAFTSQSREFSEKPDSGTRGLDQSESQDGQSERPWYRRFARALVVVAVLLLIGLIALLLVLFVPWPQHGGPVDAAWMNLTGFPPLPTGVATVINPKMVQQVDGCTDQPDLWSCAVPPSTDASSGSAGASAPNFKFQIQFRDGILPSSETTIEPSNNTLSRRSMGHASGASHIARRDLQWDLFRDFRFASSPAPPSTQDQIFLGRTTDNSTVPFDGEKTPFYITLLDSSALTNSDSVEVRKRDFRYPYPTPSNKTNERKSNKKHNQQTQDSPTFRYPYPSSSPDSKDPNITPSRIPNAPTTSNGDPAPAQLYPLPYAQPLKLYNRGLPTEHYGFYTYFDRTIYVSSSNSASSDGASVANTSTATNIMSNTPLTSSTAVCTWSSTRFLVQIWTRLSPVTALNATASSDIPAADSTTNDVRPPGSFPYSMTVTIDRHGGEAGEKGVYCHSLDGEGRVLQDVRTWVEEMRGWGGEIVDPAGVPVNNATATGLRTGSGGEGIDGGTGGCKCSWQNWT